MACCTTSVQQQFAPASTAALHAVGPVTLSNGAINAGYLVSESTTGRATWVPIPSSISPTASATAPSGTGVGSHSVFMGLGSTFTFTPTVTGVVSVNIRCTAFSSTVANIASVGTAYNTGTAPTNGATQTGIVFGAGESYTCAVVNQPYFYESTAVLTGLTLNTAYWFDVFLKNQPGGTGLSSVANVDFRVKEQK